MWIVALMLACAPDAPPQAPLSPEPAAEVVAPVGKGLDARLTGYDYPYPVQLHEVRMQQQDLQMAYMDVAPDAPNGRVVLLLHGKNFSGAYWGSTIEALLDAGYRVVVPDQVGFGKSSKPAHLQYSFQALATATAGLLDALEVTDVHVVGHSMGGMLATRFALMFPERAASLVLMNPIGLEDYKRVVPWKPVDWWYAQQMKTTPESVKAYMQASYFDGQWRPAYDPLLDIQAGWAEGPDKELVAWNSALTYDMIFTQPVVQEFGDLQVPTLLLIGDRDRTALGKPLVSEEVRATLGDYPKLARAAQEAIPGARLELLEGIGHVPQVEAPERTWALLVGFLEQVGGQDEP